ncbi:PEP/pyruvate-binding domain-containing protein [Desulfonatronovibrio magnus]|uniref:PEP/pyruvate-binding domain-containing protein n=1 Tax=Desulfonatronovibrio magnus TaxID=698827 RepID=UPI0005EB7668|nr:PEP/pyruvate-binding domain-containing protein [Desulfonatronovibrio magnus]
MWITQLFSYWSRQIFAPGTLLRKKYQYFRDLLALDRYCLEKMAEIEEIHYRSLPCDYARLIRLSEELDDGVAKLIKSIIALNPLRYKALRDYHKKVSFYMHLSLNINDPDTQPPYALPIDQELKEDLAGGKAMNLSLIKSKGFIAPRGFCITTNAFNSIVSANVLRPKINELLSRVCLDSIDDFEKRCAEIQDLILDAVIPDDVQEEIDTFLNDFQGSRLAVRSSAFGEDSDLSFAGQYKSLLKVKPEEFADAFRQVLASKYSPRAMTYRIHAGLPDELLPMAVLVLEMVDADQSGVVYSSGVKDKDEMGIYIVSGLGDKLVSGEVKAKEYFINKKENYEFHQDLPSYLQKLHDQALKLEALFEKPQDIEWVVDKKGSLFLLQTRPLHAIKPDNDAPRLDLPVLAKGEWASPGLISGKIFVIQSKEEISRIPKGSIVVAPGLYPELTAATDLLGGVITREGSAASHFATIAREGSIPVIINVAEAMDTFQNNQLVTLDGNRGIVHDGKAEPRMLFSSKKKTWLTERMKKALEHISTLNLKDADSEDFVPQNCRSMHDLIRFTHEMGVREMFALTDRKGRGLYRSKVLDLDIPLVFRVLNLEKGLTEQGDSQTKVSLDDVTCKPFLAMFSGLGHEKIEWDANIQHFDWQEFDKVSAGVFDPTKSALLSSYGLLASDYMHALIRFGYHFVVVDALLGKEKELNYIQFSFKGGGADESKRLMRLETIRMVLAEFDFSIEVRGDLLKAEYSRESMVETEKRLKVVGYILGRTRLKDMSMDEEKIKKLAQEYSGEIHDILGI